MCLLENKRSIFIVSLVVTWQWSICFRPRPRPPHTQFFRKCRSAVLETISEDTSSVLRCREPCAFGFDHKGRTVPATRPSSWAPGQSAYEPVQYTGLTNSVDLTRKVRKVKEGFLYDVGDLGQLTSTIRSQVYHR